MIKNIFAIIKQNFIAKETMACLSVLDNRFYYKAENVERLMNLQGKPAKIYMNIHEQYAQ